MVVENPKNRVYGSAALAPEINPVPQKETREQQKQQREARRKARTEKRNKIVKFTLTVMATGVVAGLVIGRYSAMYENQKQISELQQKISEANASSEDLSIKLMKFNNIAYVEKVATEELGMVEAKSSDAVYSDVDGIEFKNPDVDKEEPSQGILSKIKGMLFN